MEFFREFALVVLDFDKADLGKILKALQRNTITTATVSVPENMFIV